MFGWGRRRSALVVAAGLLALTACGGGGALTGRLAAAGENIPAPVPSPSATSSPVPSSPAPVVTAPPSTPAASSPPPLTSPPSSTPPAAGDPVARYSPGMAYDAKDQVVVMFGGATWDNTCDCQDYLGDTWLWDGRTWRQVDPAHSPSARAYPEMAYDPADGEIVLFGGSGWSGSLSDTWTWNGSDWTQQSSSVSPPATTIQEGMAFFPAMGTVLLYSGDNPQGGNALYSWNGSNWGQIAVPGIPLASSFQAGMAMDPDGRAMNLLIFDDNDMTNLHDWTFDGTGWRQLTVTTPPTRALVQTAADDRSGDIVMFGGSDHNDTWVSSGGDWTQVFPPHSPPSLSGSGPTPGVAYDAATGQVVLFGGWNDGAVNSTWTWNGRDWTQVG